MNKIDLVKEESVHIEMIKVYKIQIIFQEDKNQKERIYS
jgi:hypothetical protein